MCSPNLICFSGPYNANKFQEFWRFFLAYSVFESTRHGLLFSLHTLLHTLYLSVPMAHPEPNASAPLSAYTICQYRQRTHVPKTSQTDTLKKDNWYFCLQHCSKEKINLFSIFFPCQTPVSFGRKLSSQHCILVTDLKNYNHDANFKAVRKLLTMSHYQLQNLL